MSDPVFGISITQTDGEARTAVTANMSVVGLVVTAPDADPTVFPLDTPVTFYSDDVNYTGKLGAAGTAYDAIAGINEQLGTFQVAAQVVLVRAQQGVDVASTIGHLAGDVNARTGMFALLNAAPMFGVVPRLVAVPGYTSQITPPAVANAVIAGLPSLLNRLLAHAVVDGPGANSAAAVAWRTTISSQRIIPIDQPYQVEDADGTIRTVPASPSILGIAVRRDHEFGGRPFHSWANQSVGGIVGLGRYVDFSIFDGATEGQGLLDDNIGITVRGNYADGSIADGGFVYIGTDNCSDDPLWRFYNVTRGRDYIHLLLIKTLRFYLGKFNLTGQAIQAVVNTVNFALRDLQADNDILGARVGFTRASNTSDNLRNGRFTFFFQAEEPAPLRRIDIQSGRMASAYDILLTDLLAQLDVTA